MAPLFVVQEIPDYDISEEMKLCKGRKKLLAVMKAKKILLCTPLIK